VWGGRVYMQDDLKHAEQAQRRAALGRLGLCEVILQVDAAVPHRAHRLYGPTKARALSADNRAWH